MKTQIYANLGYQISTHTKNRKIAQSFEAKNTKELEDLRFKGLKQKLKT